MNPLSTLNVLFILLYCVLKENLMIHMGIAEEYQKENILIMDCWDVIKRDLPQSTVHIDNKLNIMHISIWLQGGTLR